MNKPTIFITELIPTTGALSFYGKAKIIDPQDGFKYLVSYTTIVAGIDANGNPYRYADKTSNTTNKHIRSFLKQFNVEYDHFWELPLMKKPDFPVQFK